MIHFTSNWRMNDTNTMTWAQLGWAGLNWITQSTIYCKTLLREHAWMHWIFCPPCVFKKKRTYMLQSESHWKSEPKWTELLVPIHLINVLLDPTACFSCIYGESSLLNTVYLNWNETLRNPSRITWIWIKLSRCIAAERCFQQSAVWMRHMKIQIKANNQKKLSDP